MKRPFLLYLLISALAPLLLFGCDLCGVSDLQEGSLEGDHLFIAAVLVPDNQRTWRQEVFVGDVRYNEAPPEIFPGQDSILQRVILTVRARYYAEFMGDNDAIVEIIDESDESFLLQPVGNGYYTDRYHRLRIEAGKTYRLSVWRGGREYEGTTTVPEQFNFLDVADGDTVIAAPDVTNQFTRHIPVYSLNWSLARHAIFYQMLSLRDDVEGIFCSMDFYPGLLGHVYPGPPDTTTYTTQIVDMFGIDINYANLFHAGTPWNGGPAWTAWFDEQERKSLIRRSSIIGDDNVTGLFGSASRATVWFVTETSR